MDAERQVCEATIRQLRSLLEAQERLRRAAEAMAREARQELERVAEALCPEEVDRLRVRSPQGLGSLSPRQIADMVVRRAALRPAVPALGRMEARIADLEARLRAALDRATRAEAEVAALREKIPLGGGHTPPLREIPQARGEGREGFAEPSSPPSPRGEAPRDSEGCVDERRQALVQQAADLLVAAGYLVDRVPAPISLPDGTAFQPDLVIHERNRLLPVEVEDLARSLEEREARWEACYRLTGGDLRFVAPDPETLDRVRSEVFFWLGLRPFSLRMTDLSYGKGRRGEAVWRIRRGVGW